MIRLIQRRLIIPRGDTGSFSIPVLSKGGTDNIAVFTIFDETTRTKMFQKIISGEGDVLNIAFTHSDTVNLKPGKYVWDIKYYKNPEYIDDELVNGEEINSYYAGFSLPVCEIRETADNYLVSPEAPTATLSPEQLEIVTGAIHSLNEAIRKTQENVEHYPEIRDEVWYVWDAELGDYVSTDVRANGIVGNGIASAVLNNDYTLTLNFTDGTSFTSPSIRGQRGNGIDDIVLNNDFTLTISYTDGESYTTPSIRGPIGPTPHFSIGTVQEGPSVAASITGTAENPVLNLTLSNAYVPTRVSELENDANYAVDANYIHTDNNYTTAEKNKLSGIAAGAEVNVNADWNAVSGDAQILNKPTNVSDFMNDAGYLTEHQDLSDYVQKTDYANDSTTGVIKLRSNGSGGLIMDPFNLDTIVVNPATITDIKQAAIIPKPIIPYYQHSATFYGLAKAAGDTTQSQSSNAVGAYTNEAKAAIQQMLDVPSTSDIPTQVSELTNDAGYLTAETDPTVPAWAKAAQKPSYTAAEVGAPTVAEMNTAIGTAIGQINSFDMAVVQALPTQDISTHTIYLVPKTGETNDVYDEYVYINNNWEMVGNTQIDLSDYATKDELPDVPVQDVQVNGVSVLDDGIANVPVASTTSFGAVKVGDRLGLNNDGALYVYRATGNTIKTGTSNAYTLTPSVQHESAFYGLAKAAGDSTQSASSNPVGTYTNDAKAAIQQMLDVPSTSDIPNVPVQDVQVNGTSILDAQGVANVPIASPNDLGVIKVVRDVWGLFVHSTQKYIGISKATDAEAKAGRNSYKPIVPNNQHTSTFYGLAKAAGADMASISNTTVGIYPDAQKEAIQSMLGITQMLAPTNPNLVATQAYSIGDVFAANGKLYKATAAIAQDGAIIPDTNCVETTMVGESVRDVQIDGNSILENGIANIPKATSNILGVVRPSNSGIQINANGQLLTKKASSSLIKSGENTYDVIVSYNQHESTFYGLSKIAGVDLKDETVTLGTYPETSKSAIRTMIGAASSNVIAVQDTQPTDADTKIWLPETAETPIQVPTVAEMNAALSEKVDDVQVNGVSVVSGGVANVPIAGNTGSGAFGVVRIASSFGIDITNGYLILKEMPTGKIKEGSNKYYALTSYYQHESTFYGLSKVAGVDLANETVTLGTYPETSKTAIKEMLGVQDGLKVVRLI